MIQNLFLYQYFYFVSHKEDLSYQKMKLNRHYIPGPHMMQVMQLTDMSEHA